MIDVIVIGGGPAGMTAALRAGDLGAKTVLVTRDRFGGMAANDGPVPVRTLAHAARLLRDTRDLERYGIVVGEPMLDYSRLLVRVREVVEEVRAHSTFSKQLKDLGVVVNEDCGDACFTNSHTLETQSGLQLRAAKFVICTGGATRQLSVPGAEFTATHSDAWGLTAVPSSMIVIGGGATGAQVASVFNAFGSRISLFQSGPRILPTEDEEVSAAVGAAFRKSGIEVKEGFGVIDSFEKTLEGVRMSFSKDGRLEAAEAALAVTAIGWAANTASLNLARAGVETDARDFVHVDDFLCTSAPHVFAAGDVTGRMMLVPQAIQQGFVAATNAVLGVNMTLIEGAAPIGSFTDPEYAQVGLTEKQARAAGEEIVVAKICFDSTTRTIIDGRTRGFCKLIVDSRTRQILGCHVVGERAVELTQVAAVAMAGRMRVDDLAQVPLSFPTYAGVLGRVAAQATRTLNLKLAWQGGGFEGQ
ncbi:MAG TPA: NAD(P)/FAD-dependent oxidoreductase [Pyrinomonadaceae bacterium]|nr:NAD(P)/FAD-dependent oxidoreductase [Pyrinomonadaceae bacterium]